MNYRLLSKIFGAILLFVGVTMAVCALYSFLFAPGEAREGRARLAFGISAVITLACASTLLFWGRGQHEAILRRDAIIVVGMSWIFCGLFGSLPYMLFDPSLSPLRALFESISGFTTTGATVIDELKDYPKSALLWRSLTQWLGGMGILVLFVALLSYLGVGSKSLVRHESSLQMGESTNARVRDLALILWLIYTSITVICAAGYWILGMPPFDAVCHAFCTAATGGFSPRGESIGHYNSLPIELWACLIMILCSVNFILLVLILKRRWRRLRDEEETPCFLIILGISVLVVTVNIALHDSNKNFLQSLREAFFPVVSLGTTTGFATSDYDQWPAFSRLLLLILMLAGACGGSTAGGVKISRVLLLAKIFRQELVKSFRPNQVFKLKLNGNPVDQSARLQTTFYFSLATVVFLLTVLTVSLLEPSLSLESALGASMATVFNIGQGMAGTGPTGSFAHFHGGTLLLFCLLMILGRLEFLAILVLFVPGLWRKY